jgi:signal transduction histidine kinase
MTLRRKMALQILTMIVGLLLVSGAALWGLNGLHQDYGLALQGYQELRHVYTVGSHLATAKSLLTLPSPGEAEQQRINREVRAATQEFESSLSPSTVISAPVSANRSADPLDVIRQGLADAQAAASGAGSMSERLSAQEDAVNRALGGIADLVTTIRTATESRQEAALAKRRETFEAVAGLSAAVVAGGILLGALQYHSVIRPLRRLSEGVRKIAAGQFSGRVRGTDGRRDEFASLARDFNRMAEQLDSLYRELEQKVDAKTRQLIRSERLAGVGFLAAGVAHEINNPLGIIAGYAEYSLTMLPARAADAESEELKRNLRVICDEAFRCKEITTKLLSLATPAELAADGLHARRRVSLVKVAAEVASIVGGLRPYQDRRLIVKARGETEGKAGAEDAPEPIVMAVEGEMKQVVLNLTLNALEAVPAGGEVRIDLGRKGGWVELCVSDNGRGMSRQTLDRVFEPFFTERRVVPGDEAERDAVGGRRGTGLGLSITHAIVEAHGGRIEAFSDGPGRGSRFVINLPAAPQLSASLGEANEVRA